MANEILMKYPFGADASPEMDMIASREAFGTGSAIVGIGNITLDSGERLVYLEGKRDGQEVVSTPLGFQRKLERYAIVCGYELTEQQKNGGFINRIFFGKFREEKKVRCVSEEDRERVKEEFLKNLKPDCFERMPRFIEFLVRRVGLNSVS